MPNSEYLRLKALLESNPQYKTMLDTISKAEGTWGKDAYSTKFGGGKADWKKGKDQSSDGVSNAHGKYQFMNDTWFGKDKKSGLVAKLGLTGFSPEEQDIAALKLLEDSGALKHIDNGEVDKAIFAAAPIWAALPKDASGKSAMSGQKAKPLSTVLGYTKSNEAARAAINDNYKKINEANAVSYQKYQNSAILDDEEDGKRAYSSEEAVKSYWKEINNIQVKKGVSQAQKNLEKHAVKQKYYRQGYMSAINVDINETNKQYNDFYKEITKESKKDDEDLITNKGEFNPFAGIITKEKFEKLKEKAAKFNIDLGNPKYYVAGGDEKNKKALRYVNPSYISKKIKEIESIYTPRKMEEGILKYGKTKDEYDAEVVKNTPADTESDVMPDATTSETPEEIAARKEAEAKEAARGAKQLAEANKPKSNLDLLDSFNDDSPVGYTKFKYTPGKGEIPFDALIGLTTGLAGMAAADDVHTKLRDEQISEGMLQYAQDIAKIKNMGLSPEIEGGLKMKLQDAYQTGLTNIVHASNGNRNLVLGNQAQLDKARMHGIVEIAAMDVDRTDKAMASFGEIQKYINEFDATRNIANNDRTYQEDKQKQVAGIELAKQGMSSFIDAIQNAKENAPGSMNDMRRQYFQFAATGILPNAVEGEPGSKSFLEAADLKNKMFKGKIRTYSDWVNTMDQDQKELLANILAKNPQMNPTINKAEGENGTEFGDLESYFKEVSGDAEKKKSFLNNKGVTDLDVNRIEENKSKISGEPTNAPPKEIDKKHLSSTDEEITKQPLITRTKEPQISPRIVTKEKVPDAVLSQNLADKINADANITPEQRGNALSDKAELILQQSEKGNQKLDNMTNNIVRQTEQDAAYNARLNLVTRQKQ